MSEQLPLMPRSSLFHSIHAVCSHVASDVSSKVLLSRMKGLGHIIKEKHLRIRGVEYSCRRAYDICLDWRPYYLIKTYCLTTSTLEEGIPERRIQTSI